MSAGKLLTEHGYHKTFPAELGVFRPQLDAAALHVYTQANKELLPLQMFYNLNKSTCDEMLGEAGMGAVFALPSSASWADVSDELMRITSGSRLA